MPWNSTCPLGSVSVKANRPIGQQNTTYIETTMGNSIVGTNTNTTRDHFWNVGSNEDGRHRFIQSPAFTVGGNPADPVIGTGMDAVVYSKVTNGRAEWFNRNAAGIYQFCPSFLSGTVVVGGSYGTVVAVPASVYGEIFMFTTAQGKYSTVTGFFRSNGAAVESWALVNAAQGDDTANGLKFGNGSDASGLNIRARAEDASSGQTWNYRITYRAI
jgi:hypothetical protein